MACRRQRSRCTESYRTLRADPAPPRSRRTTRHALPARAKCGPPSMPSTASSAARTRSSTGPAARPTPPPPRGARRLAARAGATGSPRGRSDHPVIAALVDAGRRHDLPLQLLARYMDSMRVDCDGRVRIADRARARPLHERQRRRRRRIMAPLLGAPPERREDVARLGVAFQLTNFIRDVREDWAHGPRLPARAWTRTTCWPRARAAACASTSPRRSAARASCSRRPRRVAARPGAADAPGVARRAPRSTRACSTASSASATTCWARAARCGRGGRGRGRCAA